MERVDFDQYAGQYESILAAQTNFFDGDSNYFARYKIELAQQLVGNVGTVLDFGCGIGRCIGGFVPFAPTVGGTFTGTPGFGATGLGTTVAGLGAVAYRLTRFRARWTSAWIKPSSIASSPWRIPAAGSSIGARTKISDS